MIRIESTMTHPLTLKLPAGNAEPEIEIPAATPAKDGKPGKPGVLELEELDSVTLQRLRYHYDWRPTDGKNVNKDRDELSADEVHDIGLLRIEVLDEDGEDEGQNERKAKRGKRTAKPATGEGVPASKAA